jgi:putative transposase
MFGGVVADALDRIISPTATPRSSRATQHRVYLALEDWARRRARLHPARQPLKTNAHIEFLNGRWHHECPNVHQFLSLGVVQQTARELPLQLHQHRPHGSLGRMTLS